MAGQGAVDEARAALHAHVQPGVVTDSEQAAAAAQRVTEARYALWRASAQAYPASYPPPAAGDGRDVFRAADEGGEGKCTRKEIAKYLMRNQTLRHRLREGWGQFNANFGTEDVPRNHEELDEEAFSALWLEAAAMRRDSGRAPAAAADADGDAARFKLSSVQPMRSQLAALRHLLSENEVVDLHGLGNAINMLSTCAEILRGDGLLSVVKVRTFFPDGMRNSLGEPVPKMVIRVRRASDYAARFAALERAQAHEGDEWEARDDWDAQHGEEEAPSKPLNPMAKEFDASPKNSSPRPLNPDAPSFALPERPALNPAAAEFVPRGQRGGGGGPSPKHNYQHWMEASSQIDFQEYYPSTVPSESAQQWREEAWWRRETERLQQTARARSRHPLDYEALLAPRTVIEDAAIREYLKELRRPKGVHRTAAELLGLTSTRGTLSATEAEVDGLARIFGNPRSDRKGREWKFLVPDMDVKELCIAVGNVTAGVQEGRDQRDRDLEQRERLARRELSSGKSALLSLRLLVDLAREDGNPPRARKGESAAPSPRHLDPEEDEHDDDHRRKGGYDRAHWVPLLCLFNDAEPITNRAKPRKAPTAEDLQRQARTVHVGQLPPYAGEDDLRRVFGRCGELVSITLPTYNPNRLPPHLQGRRAPPPPPSGSASPRRPNKGFAYVEFTDNAAAEKALGLDSYPLQGRALKVAPRHTDAVVSLAVDHGRRYYLSRWDHPRFRNDRAWSSW